MTLDDIIAALSGNNQAAGYLNDPSTNPAVGRTQRYPSGIPMPNTTGPDGRRMPFPRIQGGGAPEQVVAYQRPQYPLVYGPGAGAGANEPLPQAPPRMAQPMPVRFRDAATQVGPEFVDASAPPDQEPWRQVAPTMPLYQGGGRYYGQEQRVAVGDPAERRGVEPPSAPQEPMDDDADWNAALARVRANMGRDPTGLRRLREEELAPLRDRARRSQMVASTPPRYWPRATR